MMDKFTCLRMMSMVCMMQRGMSPWFRAKIIACSSVTFRVHLQERWRQRRKRWALTHMSTCCTPAVKKTNLDSQATPHSLGYRGARHLICSGVKPSVPADTTSCTTQSGWIMPACCQADLCMPVPHIVMWQAPRRLHSSEDTHSTLTPDGWPWALGRTLTYDCISRQRSSSVLRGRSSCGEERAEDTFCFFFFPQAIFLG